ncbi:hypothetical protein [Phenylobacterium sp.]|uniref:hypothetical protein n=1 Tax=Phenylobacterium sp. TaxID=1871053 RepID=UPI002C32B4B2|nr:hypothetical protein [Phenylobacterium sp.]HVI33707.1 hypothetical protein [Phenylobacterium sp.]
MKRVASVIGVAAAGLLATACATMDRGMARQEAAATLANAAELQGTNAAEVVGRTSMAFGDRYTAANLFERAADSRASVGKRFNLAAAYEATGRLPEAVTIYRTLVDDGQYVTMRSNRPMNNPDVPVRRYNIAEESARRLTRIMVENPLMFPQQSGGALAATGFATPVAATVGGTTTSGRISDAQAMELDRLASGAE